MRAARVLTSKATPMPLWKITLAYDGTAFHGWQIQPGLPSIQGTLSQAIYTIIGEHVLPQGSGRTDAGVHALAQVASFSLRSAIPAGNLHRALNHHLPPAIRVLAVEPAPPGFHARHSARRKTYEYRVFPRRPPLPDHEARPDVLPRETRICSPMLAPYVWDTGLLLSLAALNRAAAHIVGTHDFTSFASPAPENPPYLPQQIVPEYPTSPPTNCRTITHSCWHVSGDLLIYRVTGSGFLHKMVRNLVGTFTQAGAGRTDPDSVPAILSARRRSAAGPTAPAPGLFLVEVQY